MQTTPRDDKRLNKKTVNKYIFVISLMIYPMTLWLIFYIYVNFNSIVMAFQNISLTGVKTWAGFENFRIYFTQLFDDTNLLGISMVNTVKYWTLSVLISLPIYFTVSYYFFKEMLGHNVFRAFMMLPSVVSGFIIALVFQKFIDIGLPGIICGNDAEKLLNFPNLLTHPDTSFGMMLFYDLWLGFVNGFIYYPNAMRNIDNSIIEAAKIDGAGAWEEFWLIIMPLIYPTFTTFFVLSVAGFFSTSGSSIVFFMYDAPPEVTLIGYYYTKMVMNVPSQVGYPILAAGGLVMTAVAAPITFLVKFLMEKYGPTEE